MKKLFIYINLIFLILSLKTEYIYGDITNTWNFNNKNNYSLSNEDSVQLSQGCVVNYHKIYYG